ncbi:MAG: arsenate reductase (glutaredoxin) [Flavobacteriales bacterium]|jgi:arsenate reductase|tara:strand:+ start:1409 stop:1750 length:342 start_codon:yes stop_codon:yes gene_type:complete
MKIYHNPRCSKSRQTLSLIEGKNKKVEIIEYLETPATVEEIESILEKLGIKAIDLVRKKEKIWIEDYKGRDLTDKKIIEAMVENPKIMERPIVIDGNKAIIGRPPENVLTFMD